MPEPTDQDHERARAICPHHSHPKNPFPPCTCGNVAAALAELRAEKDEALEKMHALMTEVQEQRKRTEASLDALVAGREAVEQIAAKIDADADTMNVTRASDHRGIAQSIRTALQQSQEADRDRREGEMKFIEEDHHAQ